MYPSDYKFATSVGSTADKESFLIKYCINGINQTQLSFTILIEC